MKQEHEIAMSKVREAMPRMIQEFAIHAELHRAKYNACLAQGFTEQQALELCKNLFITKAE